MDGYSLNFGERFTRTIDFGELPGAFAAFLGGDSRGRTVVRVGG